MNKIPVTIHSSRPIIVEADADSFGQIFASVSSDEQVAIFRAMVEHMKPHKIQWDYIAIELEKPENQIVWRDLAVLFGESIPEAKWQPIATCPIRESVDLWCIYGGEEYAQYDGGASIGQLVSNAHKSEEYGFFGNQSNDGVPRREGPDLKPVAWRPAVPQCPSQLIADVMGVPVTREEAIAKAGGGAA